MVPAILRAAYRQEYRRVLMPATQLCLGDAIFFLLRDFEFLRPLRVCRSCQMS
jgi:hypothetical protein